MWALGDIANRGWARRSFSVVFDRWHHWKLWSITFQLPTLNRYVTQGSNQWPIDCLAESQSNKFFCADSEPLALFLGPLLATCRFFVEISVFLKGKIGVLALQGQNVSVQAKKRSKFVKNLVFKSKFVKNLRLGQHFGFWFFRSKVFRL